MAGWQEEGLPAKINRAVAAGEETAADFFTEHSREVINSVPSERLLVFDVSQVRRMLCLCCMVTGAGVGAALPVSQPSYPRHTFPPPQRHAGDDDVPQHDPRCRLGRDAHPRRAGHTRLPGLAAASINQNICEFVLLSYATLSSD